MFRARGWSCVRRNVHRECPVTRGVTRRGVPRGNSTWRWMRAARPILLCRLNALGDKECKWLLRATRNSADVRNPGNQRQSVRTTARRLARGSASVDHSVDQWPGVQATRRPAIAFPGSEPRAEPVELQKKFASLKSDSSAHAREVPPPQPMRPPPKCVSGRPGGTQAVANPYPLCALGPERAKLEMTRPTCGALRSKWGARRSARSFRTAACPV